MSARSLLRGVGRIAGYTWAGPATLLGLAVAAVALACGARGRSERGVLEVCGGRLATWLARLPGVRHFEAVTLGHVVLADSRQALERQRAHERAHVRQFERWGVLLLPLYVTAAAVEVLRGRHPHRDNLFERQARAAEGIPCGSQES
jgi:hypothetical protein